MPQPALAAQTARVATSVRAAVAEHPLAGASRPGQENGLRFDAHLSDDAEASPRTRRDDRPARDPDLPTPARRPETRGTEAPHRASGERRAGRADGADAPREAKDTRGAEEPTAADDEPPADDGSASEENASTAGPATPAQAAAPSPLPAVVLAQAELAAAFGLAGPDGALAPEGGPGTAAPACEGADAATPTGDAVANTGDVGPSPLPAESLVEPKGVAAVTVSALASDPAADAAAAAVVAAASVAAAPLKGDADAEIAEMTARPTLAKHKGVHDVPGAMRAAPESSPAPVSGEPDTIPADAEATIDLPPGIAYPAEAAKEPGATHSVPATAASSAPLASAAPLVPPGLLPDAIGGVMPAAAGQRTDAGTISVQAPEGASGGGSREAVPISAVPIEIAARASEGKHRFEIRLDPPELGRIDVRLEVRPDGQVTSRLVVERAETLDLLRRDAPALERALQSAGLQTDGGGMQFSLRDGNNGRWSGGEHPGRPNLMIVPDDDVAVREAVRRGYGVLRGLGRGVDISI